MLLYAQPSQMFSQQQQQRQSSQMSSILPSNANNLQTTGSNSANSNRANTSDSNANAAQPSTRSPLQKSPSFHDPRNYLLGFNATSQKSRLRSKLSAEFESLQAELPFL